MTETSLTACYNHNDRATAGSIKQILAVITLFLWPGGDEGGLQSQRLGV